MNEPGASQDSDAQPIDARFEPAPDAPPRGGGGPGWVALGIASVLSAGIGGLLGIGFNANRIDPETMAPASVVEQVDQLGGFQRQMDESLVRLRNDVDAVSTRLDSEMQAIMSGATGRTAGLAAISRQITELQARLDGLETAGPVTDEPGTVPVEGLDADAVTARLAVLTRRIERLETVDGDSDSATPRLMNRAITVLQDQVDTLETGQGELLRAIESREDVLESLIARVTALEAGVSPAHTGEGEPQDADTSDPADGASPVVSPGEPGPGIDRSAAAMAIAEIEAAARRGRPFSSAWVRLAEAMPAEAAVGRIETIAETGAPTLAELRSQFDLAEAEAIEAEQSVPKKDGWDWLRNITDDMVTVRRTDGTGEGTLSRLADARIRLREDDLEGAVLAVTAIKGPPAEEMAEWLEAARARLTLEAALETLRLRMIELER